MNINSAAEFGNKVQSCGTEDAEIFYCYRFEPVRCYYYYYLLRQIKAARKYNEHKQLKYKHIHNFSRVAYNETGSVDTSWRCSLYLSSSSSWGIILSAEFDGYYPHSGLVEVKQSTQM